MAKNDEDVIKQGFMTKRSQNKKIYTPVNYKQRWFVLNRKFLIYYDNDSEDVRKTYLNYIFFFYNNKILIKRNITTIINF